MSSGFGSMMAQYYMNNMSASEMSDFSAAANNAAPYTAAINLVGDIFGVIGNAYAAKAQAQRVKYQYQMQAQQAQFQADMGKLWLTLASNNLTVVCAWTPLARNRLEPVSSLAELWTWRPRSKTALSYSTPVSNK